MDRALGYGPRGCGFDSRRVHETPLKVSSGEFFFMKYCNTNRGFQNPGHDTERVHRRRAEAGDLLRPKHTIRHARAIQGTPGRLHLHEDPDGYRLCFRHD